MKLRRSRIRPAFRHASCGRWLWVGLLAVVGFAAPTRILSAAHQDQGTNFNLEGKITRLEGEKFVVSSQENIIFHVRYTEKTNFDREDGSGASAKDLHVGIKVRVEGDLTESGEIVASKIHIQPSESKPLPKASRTPQRDWCTFSAPAANSRPQL